MEAPSMAVAETNYGNAPAARDIKFSKPAIAGEKSLVEAQKRVPGLVAKQRRSIEEPFVAINFQLTCLSL